MRLFSLLILGSVLPLGAHAQAPQWQQLSAGASAFQVDLRSLTRVDHSLRARVQTRDAGSEMAVQEVEVRCRSAEMRTVREFTYDLDTRQLRARPDTQTRKGGWIEYPTGSEGAALIGSLCQFGRERRVLVEPDTHGAA
jgi:hypothetical protein